ncbi:hypothetical protein EDEG_00351 [Edhazardia aedis USNM 41457]|uniref:Uncharacterized protein n=1 Tax=Edhazardia aedis (strain USNM 41457) TaxID=1003232 RepID=J9DGM5_EDHAE|nr:hypothetical protein EDEG_00351 [Edhazardia aedis USNM 41457]|eukprot:EJW01760.1 hypothetical protein EDEG_00351 [Edhazardia aedis USNM 41457]
MIENCLNNSYNRSIKFSPNELFIGFSFFDPYEKPAEFKTLCFPQSKEIIQDYKNNIKVNDQVVVKNYRCGKFDDKFIGPFLVERVSKRGYWIKLIGDSAWHHTKFIKILKRADCCISKKNNWFFFLIYHFRFSIDKRLIGF